MRLLNFGFFFARATTEVFAIIANDSNKKYAKCVGI